jgi:hypothetical protein
MSMQVGELALNELKVQCEDWGKTKQSFNKIPDTHDNLHSQKPESVSESNDTNYFHTSQLEINRN